MSRQPRGPRRPYLANPNHVDPEDDRVITLTRTACNGKMRKEMHTDRNNVAFYSCCVYPYRTWNGDNGCVGCDFDPKKIKDLPFKAQERIEYFKKTGEILHNPYSLEETERIMKEREEKAKATE